MRRAYKSDFSGGRRSVGSDEERGKAEVADMQATIFRGRGVAQKAAQKAARQAEQEWRAAGDNVPQLAAYMSLGERAARQESSSLNLQLPKARETKAQRKLKSAGWKRRPQIGWPALTLTQSRRGRLQQRRRCFRWREHKVRHHHTDNQAVSRRHWSAVYCTQSQE